MNRKIIIKFFIFICLIFIFNNLLLNFDHLFSKIKEKNLFDKVSVKNKKSNNSSISNKKNTAQPKKKSNINAVKKKEPNNLPAGGKKKNAEQNSKPIANIAYNKKPTNLPNTAETKKVSLINLILRHIEPKGVGYGHGYTTADLFFISDQRAKSFVYFCNGRLHVFNAGYPAANAGLGLRYIDSSWVYGFNGYYDYRKTSKKSYHQIACGLEAMRGRFDFRLNGYLPIGKTKTSSYKFSHFQGYNIILSKSREFAMRGVNAEAGYHFQKIKNYDLYAAAGPYYFNKKGTNAIGGEARFSATFNNYLKLEAKGSYDSVFKWIGQGQISFDISIGSPKKTRQNSDWRCTRQNLLRQRAYQPVDRDEIIVIHNKKTNSIAVNPDSNDYWRVIFVNSNGNSNGSYEDPYGTIAAAQTASLPGDIIYIYPKNDSTSYDATATGFVLKVNQKVFGAGTDQYLKTTKGIIRIPQQTASKPLLEGLATGVGIINLNSGNEVSGMRINGRNDASYGILGGGASSITNAQILNNTISGTFKADAIQLTSQGEVVVSQNNINATLGTASSHGRPINFNTATTISPTAIISYNTVSAITSSAILAGVDCSSTSGAFTINNNTFNLSSTSGTVIGISDDGDSSSFIITDNILTSASTSGSVYAIFAPGSTGNHTIINNTMTATSSSNFINIINTASSSGSIIINSNTLTGTAAGASIVEGIYNASSSSAYSINNNIITVSATGSNSAIGIDTGSCTGAHSIINNTVTASVNSVGNALCIYSPLSPSAPYTIRNNTLTSTSNGAVGYGITTSANAIIIDFNTIRVSGSAPDKQGIVSTGSITVQNNSVTIN